MRLIGGWGSGSLIVRGGRRGGGRAGRGVDFGCFGEGGKVKMGGIKGGGFWNGWVYRWKFGASGMYCITMYIICIAKSGGKKITPPLRLSGT